MIKEFLSKDKKLLEIATLLLLLLLLVFLIQFLWRNGNSENSFARSRTEQMS
jgi:hypothetical protein